MDDGNRTVLRPRREHRTDCFTWNDHRILASVSFDDSGRGREVFIDTEGAKGALRQSSDVMRLAQDATIAVSIALQHGATLTGLLTTMIRADLSRASEILRNENTGIAKPSLLVAALMTCVTIEMEEGDRIAQAHAALRAPYGGASSNNAERKGDLP